MLETILALVSLIALIMLVRSAYRRVAQPVDLPNPVLVEHEGEYSAVIAPHLTTAQPLIESFIRTLHTQLNVIKLDASKNSSTLYFKIHDKETISHRGKYYLLAITLRDGTLHFQAVAHRARDSKDVDSLLKTIQEASSHHLANVPSHGTYYAEIDSEIITALTTAAQDQALVAHPLVAR